MSKPICQNPKKKHTFLRKKDGAKEAGILPKIGESNDFAIWNPDSRSSLGGWWKSRRFQLEAGRDCAKKGRRGTGRTGLLGRFCRIKAQSKYDCKRRNSGKSISNTSEEMLKIWKNQKGICVCGSPLQLLEAHVDHDHETGKVRAFLHPTCNVVEGLLGNKTKKEIHNLFAWIWSKR